MIDSLGAIASIFTAIGVFVSAVQIYLIKNQERTNFEDDFAREYRSLMSKIPTKALLGDALSPDEHKKALDEFYHYFDLCNEQIFQRKIGRISEATWIFWKEGIISNLNRPAFSKAWSEISEKSGNDFSELRKLCPPKRAQLSRLEG